MLGSARLWSIFRECLGGRSDAVSGPAGQIVGHGIDKSDRWVAGHIGVIYCAWQIIPPELANYSFQDDLRSWRWWAERIRMRRIKT